MLPSWAMRIPSLITVIALVGFALACGGSTDYPEEPHIEEPGEPEIPLGGGDDPFSSYVNSRYEYCDAKVLGALWGEDTYTAKSSIGQMLMDGEGALLEEKLAASRQRALDDLSNRDIRCHYDDIGVSYDDAVALAQYWGVDTWEAKMRAEEKFLRDGNNDQYVRSAIHDAHNAGY